MAERFAANGGNSATDEFAHLLPEITASTERLRFNVLYRGPQKFAWTDIPLAEVKAIRHTCGTSVNDVILALVTATIRRYSELHGDRVKGTTAAHHGSGQSAGQRRSGRTWGIASPWFRSPFPLDIRNPRKLLAAVHRRTEFLKRAHAAELVSLAGGLIGMFPNSVQALAGHIISQLPFTPFNMVCTNVPGPQYPLYLLGPQDAALLSLCSGRRRDGDQLRHPELRRHGVFRVQRRCACSAGSAAFGEVSEVEFHGAAGSSRGHTPAKGRAKESEREQGACQGEVAPAPSAPPPVRASIHPPPLSFSRISQFHEGPQLRRRKVLTK